jgi:Lar family restriction alleviation protein
MTEKLLPCPFCGGEASADGHIRYSEPLIDTWWPGDIPITEAFYVNCIKCGAVSRSGIVNGYQTRAEAIKRWNTRSPDPSVAVLREALEKIAEPLAGVPVGDPWAFYADLQELARSALSSTNPDKPGAGFDTPRGAA